MNRSLTKRWRLKRPQELPALSKKHKIARDNFIAVAKKVAVYLRAGKKIPYRLDKQYTQSICELRSVLYLDGCYKEDDYKHV